MVVTSRVSLIPLSLSGALVCQEHLHNWKVSQNVCSHIIGTIFRHCRIAIDYLYIVISDFQLPLKARSYTCTFQNLYFPETNFRLSP